MHRFFYPHSDLEREFIQITDLKEVNHLRKVLRLKPNSQIKIFNNELEIVGTIQEVTHQKFLVRKDYVLPKKIKKQITVTLVCAIPKKSKFEFIIEKCTELDVDEIIPMKTARTEFVLNSGKQRGKEDRYLTVAINAAKQSGRLGVPRVYPITKTPEVFHQFDRETLCLIAALTTERRTLFEVFKQENILKFKKIVFFIGPEGDFTPQELSWALEAGCIPVSLGCNILKVDTAAISCISFVNCFLDHIFR